MISSHLENGFYRLFTDGSKESFLIFSHLGQFHDCDYFNFDLKKGNRLVDWTIRSLVDTKFPVPKQVTENSPFMLEIAFSGRAARHVMDAALYINKKKISKSQSSYLERLKRSSTHQNLKGTNLP